MSYSYLVQDVKMLGKWQQDQYLYFYFTDLVGGDFKISLSQVICGKRRTHAMRARWQLRIQGRSRHLGNRCLLILGYVTSPVPTPMSPLSNGVSYALFLSVLMPSAYSNSAFTYSSILYSSINLSWPFLIFIYISLTMYKFIDTYNI